MTAIIEHYTMDNLDVVIHSNSDKTKLFEYALFHKRSAPNNWRKLHHIAMVRRCGKRKS